MPGMLIFLSTIVLAVIVVGLIYRRKPKIHMPVMTAAFALDVGLVLYIELTRHAIKTVGSEIAEPTHNSLLYFHVAVSLLTLLLYIALTVTGVQLYKGDQARRSLHRGLAAVFILARLTNYVTSFWMG